MFGIPAAVKWAMIAAIVLGAIGTGVGIVKWIGHAAQLKLIAASLAKSAKTALEKRGVEADVSRLDVERLLICNSATTDEEFACCHHDRKCVPLEKRDAPK